MSPYRVSGKVLEKAKCHPRPFYKKYYYKLLIKLKGKWKDRFGRCDKCLFHYKFRRGGYYDPTMFFHQLECHLLNSGDEK